MRILIKISLLGLGYSSESLEFFSSEPFSVRFPVLLISYHLPNYKMNSLLVLFSLLVGLSTSAQALKENQDFRISHPYSLPSILISAPTELDSALPAGIDQRGSLHPHQQRPPKDGSGFSEADQPRFVFRPPGRGRFFGERKRNCRLDDGIFDEVEDSFASS